MIRHIVMWKLRGPSPEERAQQAEQVRSALLGMRGQIPGMSSLEVGIGAVAGAEQADVVLFSTHDSWEALAAYMNHPEHAPVKELIGSLRTERRVIDFEL